MCGFAGYFNQNGNLNLNPALQLLEPRGPDESGLWHGKQVGLGHRRLSIIDPFNGRQPFFSEDRKIVIVYNGEIYNFRDLKEELENNGIAFKTSCDTEVLLYAYQVWGTKMLCKLDGIFAFSIYDDRKKTFLLARDRCGVKPLFYQIDSGKFCFASTLTAIATLQNQKFQLDYNSLYDFLAFQATLSPNSIFRSIKQLEPAHYLRYSITDNRTEVNRYWEIPKKHFEGSFNDAVSFSEQAIEQSVKRQLFSDVPIGAFLSGGIDSSLLVHYAAKVRSKPIDTFSMSFADKKYDETNFAQEVSNKYGTHHHIVPSPKITPDLLFDSVESLDQPLADPAYPMTWLLSRETQKLVSVALSGDGGDEIFGGYSKYNDLSSLHPDSGLKKFFRYLYKRKIMTGKICGQMLHGEHRILYKKVECGNYPGNRKHFSNFLNPDISKHINGDPINKWVDAVFANGGFDSRLAMMKADLYTYLSENCLTKTDRGSMSWGLEVRVPFLGNDVLDFALSLTDRFHFKNGVGKQILLAISKKYLPNAVWNRKKHGFSVPLHNLFKNEWKSPCEEILLYSEKNIPIFNYRKIRLLWNQVLKGKASARIFYTIIVFLIWCRKNSAIIKF